MRTLTKPGQSELTTMDRKDIRLHMDLYPRYNEEVQIAAAYAEAKRAGAKFPRIKVDQHGRVIDGKHRLMADDINGQTQIDVERVFVADDTEFFKLAATANAHHGRRYTSVDYAHILLKGRELGIPDSEIASLIYVTPDYLEEATRDWFALNGKSEQVALKRTIRHMRGRKLTVGQIAANKKLSGMHATFYMNQIMLLMDNDLLDYENPKVLEKLNALQESLGNYQLLLAKKQRGGRRTNGSKN